MSTQSFQTLLKNDKYQVFLFVCPANIPVNFALHPWFVLNQQGVVSRWEVLFGKNKNNPKLGHLHIDHSPLFQGIDMLPFSHKYFWSAELIGYAEGDSQSLAKRMVELIENSKARYPYFKKYRLLGPNSNTYVQWILDHFPEFEGTLSWRAVGKNMMYN
jgi:Protein of unknown function (DUF3750)